MFRILTASAILLLLSSSIVAQAYAIPITAKSWVVTDDSGKVIQSENSDQVRSIASISKLITVMIVLDAKQDLDDKVSKNYTRRQLIQMALVSSNNPAADMLCNYYPGGRQACIRALNTKVQNLGMIHSRLVEPSGLSIMNVSTANDLVLAIIAAQSYPEVQQAAITSSFSITISRAIYVKHRHRTSIHARTLVFNNTNHNVGTGKFIVSKTGYIRASGGCIASMLITSVGKRVVVVLGSHNTHTRVPELEYLAENSKRNTLNLMTSDTTDGDDVIKLKTLDSVSTNY
jgi:D-alanyl-D-alanine endopeptidase (penicillin-binding protein 7)